MPEMNKLIARAALGNVEFSSREFQTARELALFSEACKELENRDQLPTKVRNGDGTVTFHDIDVTVEEKVLEGRDVLEVRPPKDGETFLGTSSGDPVTTDVAFPGCKPRIILGPKSEPPVQQFREGGFYRDVDGVLHGPLQIVQWTESSWSFLAERERTYQPDGTGKNGNKNLIPVEVPVWEHPGLRAGLWFWRNDMLGSGKWSYSKGVPKDLFASWTDPPRAGCWKVSEGQKYATWEGE